MPPSRNGWALSSAWIRRRCSGGWRRGEPCGGRSGARAGNAGHDGRPFAPVHGGHGIAHPGAGPLSCSHARRAAASLSIPAEILRILRQGPNTCLNCLRSVATATISGVNVEGELRDAQRAVLWSRLASRVLWPLSEFERTKTRTPAWPAAVGRDLSRCRCDVSGTHHARAQRSASRTRWWTPCAGRAGAPVGRRGKPGPAPEPVAA